MNILMIAPQYRPMIGGYEIAAERLSGALCREGHEVTVVTERIRHPSQTCSNAKRRLPRVSAVGWAERERL